MSFRPIQPAGQQSNSTPTGAEPLGDSDIFPRKRSHITRQACDNCRKTKSKCDGERPACSTCTSKDQICSYDPKPPGETVFVRTRTRLKALETLVTSLMQRSDHEAFNILRQIRTSGTIDLLLESGLVDLPSPSTDQIITPSRSPMSPSPLPLAFPAIDIIEQGIDEFFSNSAKIFHVFSPKEIQFQLHAMAAASTEAQKLAVCCTSIVAAVGLQFADSIPSEDAARALYTVARGHFQDIVEAAPLDAMKICVLLAMYHTMCKSTVGLAYIEIGLRLARRHGLYSSHRNPNTPENKWIEYRTTWRTLLFQASWLACTLGYVSCVDVISLRVPLGNLLVDTPTDFIDVVQTEMAKIVFLSADMLRACLSFEDPDLRAIEPIMKLLHDWYVMLPKDMHLGSLERDGLTTGTRRSIYHIHLLYLNAIMLLYRRVSAKCSKMLRLERARGNVWAPSDSFRRILQDGTIAAKHTSRILSLLLDEDALFKRCWLVIYQAYTSATILLYSVIQKQLHGYDPSEWAEDLAQTERCMYILEYCGSKDSVAQKLHAILAPSYQVIREHVRSKRPGIDDYDASELPCEAELFQSLNVADEFTNHLHSLPPGSSPEHVSTSLYLLSLVCRPFDDPENEIVPSLESASSSTHYTYEYLQMVERLDWDFGYGVPFQWGTDEQACRLVYGRLVGLARSGIFLGSARPSGWKS